MATRSSAYPRARWKPRLSILGLLGGLVMGLGVVVLLQQYGKLYPTTEILVGGVVGGCLVGGIVVPSLLRLVAVRRINRAIARVEARRTATAAVTPAMPVAAMAAPVLAPSGWVGSHVVAGPGMSAWAVPDAGQPAVAPVDAGVEVRVLQTQTGWAQVEFANGWIGWVDEAGLRKL